MNTFLRNRISRILALLAAFALAFAQGGAQAQPAYAYSQQELDQMLAPIALYPDPLLSQILMAATYPMEVIEAARWAREHPDLSGDAAVRAAEAENWDPSVKSLLAFPQVLARMRENLQWTQSLGDAFLGQEPQLMDTVQTLRRRAQAAGKLRSDERVSVVQSGPHLLLQPFDSRLVYVPYYDPLVVYGSWWWPAAPPMYLRPWAGYYARPAYAGGFYWGPPVSVSLGFFFGAIDWHQRQVRVVQVNNDYYRYGAAVNRAVGANRAPGAWQHEPEHRRGIAYHGIAAQQRFGVATASQDRGNRLGQAHARRPDPRVEVHPAAPAATRTEARYDGRRPDVRPTAETRAYVQPAPVAQTPAAATRFDHRRDMRSAIQAAPFARPAPGMQRATVAQGAPAVRPAPITQAAPAAGGTRPAARPEPHARHEARQAGEGARRQDAGADPIGRAKSGR